MGLMPAKDHSFCTCF